MPRQGIFGPSLDSILNWKDVEQYTPNTRLNATPPGCSYVSPSNGGGYVGVGCRNFIPAFVPYSAPSLTPCGRPPLGDLTMVPALINGTTIGGDPHYGTMSGPVVYEYNTDGQYVVNCDASSDTTCTGTSSCTGVVGNCIASTNQNTVGFGEDASTYGGSVYSASPCIAQTLYTSSSDKTDCPGNNQVNQIISGPGALWDNYNTVVQVTGGFTLNQQLETGVVNFPLCCGGVYSSSEMCEPSVCPVVSSANSSTFGGNNCAPSMAVVCTASPSNTGLMTPSTNSLEGTSVPIEGGAFYDPGSSDTTPIYRGLLQKACNRYIDLTSPSEGSYVASSAASSYLSEGIPSTIETDTFADRVVDWCTSFPGACDSVLDVACNSTSLEDLTTSNTAVGGISNLTKLCGCHLPADQYPNPNSTSSSTACTTACRLPGVIPQGESSGCTSTSCSPQQCTDNVCFIDDVAINVIDSSVGTINVGQLCNTESGTQSQCYIDKISLQLANSAASFDFTSACDECFIYDPTDPTATTAVSCTNPLGDAAGNSGSGTGNSGTSSSSSGNSAVGIGVVLFAILCLLGLLILFFL